MTAGPGAPCAAAGRWVMIESLSISSSRSHIEYLSLAGKKKNIISITITNNYQYNLRIPKTNRNIIFNIII